MRVLLIVLNDVAHTDFAGEEVERFAVYNAGPDFGKKSFRLIRKLFEEVVGYSSAKNSVAKIFEAFVRFLESITVFFRDRTMDRCESIQLEV